MLTALTLRVPGVEVHQPVKVSLPTCVAVGPAMQLSISPNPPAISCAPLTDLTNGMPITYDTTVNSSGNYPFGTVATFSCVSGFGLSGSGAASSVCGGDGSSSVGVFDPISPTCECMLEHDLFSVLFILYHALIYHSAIMLWYPIHCMGGHFFF